MQLRIGNESLKYLLLLKQGDYIREYRMKVVGFYREGTNEFAKISTPLQAG